MSYPDLCQRARLCTVAIFAVVFIAGASGPAASGNPAPAEGSAAAGTTDPSGATGPRAQDGSVALPDRHEFEPENLTPILTRTEWIAGEDGWNDTRLVREYDPTLPTPTKWAARRTIDEQHNLGSSPGRSHSPYFDHQPWRTLFFSYWLKLDENWLNTSNNVSKIMYAIIRTSTDPQGDAAHHDGVNVMSGFAHNTIAGRQGPLTIGGYNQTKDGPNQRISRHADHDRAFEIPRGEWFQVALLLVANTPGQADGVARIFIRLPGEPPVETHRSTSMMWAVKTDEHRHGPLAVWRQIQWTPTWGSPPRAGVTGSWEGERMISTAGTSHQHGAVLDRWICSQTGRDAGLIPFHHWMGPIYVSGSVERISGLEPERQGQTEPDR